MLLIHTRCYFNYLNLGQMILKEILNKISLFQSLHSSNLRLHVPIVLVLLLHLVASIIEHLRFNVRCGFLSDSFDIPKNVWQINCCRRATLQCWPQNFILGTRRIGSCWRGGRSRSHRMIFYFGVILISCFFLFIPSSLSKKDMYFMCLHKRWLPR